MYLEEDSQFKVKVRQVLEVTNSNGIEFELEEDALCTIWTKDGSCMAVEIVEICDGYLKVIDEDGEVQKIYFDNITDIQEG